MDKQSILHATFAKLNIGDALALSHAFPDDRDVQDHALSRCSPAVYLSQAFRFPVTLLAAMFDTGAVLSGSRAADFFVPGSARPGSDWDFYVPGYKESVKDMLNALSICGVKWDQPMDTIAKLFTNIGSVEIPTQTLHRLESWIDERSSPSVFMKKLESLIEAYKKAPKSHDAEAYNFEKTSASGIKVTAVKGTNVLADSSYRNPRGDSFGIIYGTVKCAAGEQQVQLIIGSHYGSVRSCLSLIKDFYASHVQCFIGGWCSSHMYYQDVISKKAKLWQPEDKMNSQAVQRAVAKYKERGFTFYTQNIQKPKVRRFMDDEAIFLDHSYVFLPLLYGSAKKTLLSWLEERRENIETIEWTEYGGEIFAIYSPMEICFRRSPKTFKSMSSAIPINRLRRLLDMVTMTMPENDPQRAPCLSVVRDVVKGGKCDLSVVARSGNVYNGLVDATPWSWAL